MKWQSLKQLRILEKALKLGLDPLREQVFSVTGARQLEPDIEDHARPRYEVATGVETF